MTTTDYDYGYTYGPSVGVDIYASPRLLAGAHRWHGGWHGRRTGRATGNWSRPGRRAATAGPCWHGPCAAGRAARNWQRPGTGIGAARRRHAAADLRGGWLAVAVAAAGESAGGGGGGASRLCRSDGPLGTR